MKGNRKFWKTVNPLFLEKPYSNQSISFINKDGLIIKNEDLAKTFNKLGIEYVPDDNSNLSNFAFIDKPQISQGMNKLDRKDMSGT